jgi:ubiquinone/menaquinone biosynthesis C-methylase UbiE
MSDRLSAGQWSTYWQKGTITTFQGRFQNNYDGPVQVFWEAIFASLNADAQIVDLATGNGALALLASQYARLQNKPFHITAIDYAHIDPGQQFRDTAYSRLMDRIRWQPGTPMENTGLPDGHFDAAISQFGFEYGEQQASISEVSRILKPNGATFAAMMHHADSAIIGQAKDGADQIMLCEKSKIQPLITDMVKRLDKLQARGKDPATDEKAEALRKSLNEHTAALETLAKRFRDPAQIKFFVENSMLPFDPKFQPDQSRPEKLKVLQSVNLECSAYKQRMRDLISSARSDQQINELVQKLTAEGFTVSQSQPFVFEGTHFAHVLVAKR